MAEKQPDEYWGQDDRRKSQRADLEGEAGLRCAGREYILTSRNVSEGGMSAGPAPGLSAPLEGSILFHLPPKGLPVACRCRVVYSTDGRGLGIEFLDLSEDSRLLLKNFVDEAN